MSVQRSSLVVGLAILLGIAWTRISIRAQDGENPVGQRARAVSVVDSLERAFSLPFSEPTRLDEVSRFLGRELRAPVTLDRAALDRLDLRPDDTVQLQLEGVRLKVGLKLLLDQVGLTYRVVPEDNLLILTDDQGADDPLKRVLAELKALHRDVHDVQDAVDDVLAVLGMEEEGPTVRKPTIIEEVPAEPAEKAPAPENPVPRTRPGA